MSALVAGLPWDILVKISATAACICIVLFFAGRVILNLIRNALSFAFLLLAVTGGYHVYTLARDAGILVSWSTFASALIEATEQATPEHTTAEKVKQSIARWLIA